MDIEFKATIVEYSEAIGGDIIQVLFAEGEDEDPFNITFRYLCLSSNYEFDFNSNFPQAEWFDGNEIDAGASVVSYKIGSNEVKIQLNNGYVFNIHYEQPASLLAQIRAYLSRECREIDI